jgi:hypothetical protein
VPGIPARAIQHITTPPLPSLATGPRTERVTTTALASRTRADTDAGLGTVDDVGLANRQEHNATPVALAADPAGRRRPLLAAQSRARVVAEEMPVQQRRQVSSTIAEPARP